MSDQQSVTYHGTDTPVLSGERAAQTPSELAEPAGSGITARIDKMTEREVNDAIDSTHPMMDDSDDAMRADILAMTLVGQRHAKRELVHLVRWLLLGAPNNQLTDECNQKEQA